MDNPGPPSSDLPSPSVGGEPPAPSQDERNMALLCYLCQLLPGLLGLGGILVLWLTQKDTKPFVDRCGKEVLNWMITSVIVAVCCIPLVFLGVCCFLLGIPALLIVIGLYTYGIVTGILGAVKASNGQFFKHPICLRLVK